jgi:hypothetical protein
MTVETESVILSISHNMLFVKIKEDANFILEQVRKDRELTREILNDDRVLVLVDASSHFFNNPDALNYAASVEGNYNRKAVAFYSGSLASTIKLRHFKNTNKPVVPTEIFKTKQEAFTWLSYYM